MKDTAAKKKIGKYSIKVTSRGVPDLEIVTDLVLFALRDTSRGVNLPKPKMIPKKTIGQDLE